MLNVTKPPAPKLIKIRELKKGNLFEFLPDSGMTELGPHMATTQGQYLCLTGTSNTGSLWKFKTEDGEIDKHVRLLEGSLTITTPA